MKFATVSTLRASSQPALVIDDRVHTLPYADMHTVIAVGAETATRKASKDSFALDEVTFHSPIHPATLRDAYAFETHVKTANRNRGQEVPENWYRFPVFYFSNPNNNYGHEGVVPYPSYTQALDYELEIAVVIGQPGINIKPEDAPDYIFGYTIFNDFYWSFGDIIARASQSVMLPPGDVIGSGTVGTGCLYGLAKNQGPWLKEGDVVELEIERIGVLRNTVGKKGL